MKKLALTIMIAGTILASCNKEVTPGYEGEDLTKVAKITRDKETKEASFKIDIDGKWELYAGPDVEHIDFSAPLLQGEYGGIYALDVPDSVRSYFQLVTEKGRALLAENHLPMEGGYNFRDLGGIKTTDNRYIKWGKLIRSDDMHHLTDADLTYLASLPVTTVVDFRSNDEIKVAPDRLPSTVKASYAYSMTPGNLSDFSTIFELLSTGVDTLMQQMNVELVTDTAAIKRYHDFFALLQNEENIPLLYHCSAGKDRTGMGTALILFALGVDEETILSNYLQSNVYLADKYAQYINEYPQLKPLFEVKREFIEAGINQIKADYGTVENYLRTVLEVDIEKFREMYLY